MSRFLCILALLTLCAALGADRPVRPASQIDSIDRGAPRGPLAGIRPEVRLRKLHLVRPDLIPYPISMEIVC